jgi:hypothetical protein
MFSGPQRWPRRLTRPLATTSLFVTSTAVAELTPATNGDWISPSWLTAASATESQATVVGIANRVNRRMQELRFRRRPYEASALAVPPSATGPSDEMCKEWFRGESGRDPFQTSRRRAGECRVDTGPQKRTFELWSSSVREQEVRQTRSVLAVTLRGRPYSRPLMYFLLLFSLS